MLSSLTRKNALLSSIAFLGLCLPPSAEALTIKFIYESSVATSPQANDIKAAVERAGRNIEQRFTNPITVNIQVGWGTIAGGYPMGGGALGAATPSWAGYYSPAEVKARLLSTPLSAIDQAAYGQLPADSYFNGSAAPFYMLYAQQKALGLRAATSTAIDGHIGFGSTYPFTFDNTNGVAAGTYDLTAVAEHEIGHVMGRIVATAPYAAVFNLFDYTAPGVPATTSFSGSYFSLDGGVTRTRNFDDVGRDDWNHDALSYDASSGYADSFATRVPSGVKRVLKQADIDLLDVVGYTTIAMPTPINGQCGSANGVTTTTVPTTGLCNIGTATPVSGTGPWTWSCLGSGGGSSASCSAPVPVAAPAAPTNLQGTVLSSTGKGKRATTTYQVSLGWQQTGTINYNVIYRSTGTGAPSLLAQTSTATTSYLDKTVTHGVTYTYVVKAVNSGGASVASNSITITP